MSERGVYRSAFESLADDHDFQELTPLAQAVFWTLKLKLGQYGIAVFYVSTLAEIHRKATPAQITDALAELERAKPGRSHGWIRRERNVVWIINGLRFEPSITLENKNHRTGALRFARTLPQTTLVQAFIQHYALDGTQQPSANGIPDGMGDAIGDRPGMVGGITELELETEPEQETETDPRARAAVVLSVAANKGLAEHPKRPQPIARIMASSGKSHEAADAILAAGVPLAFAESVVYELARTHSADGEVQTLKYFSPGVIRRWQQEQAGTAAKSAAAPSILPRRVPGEPDELTARVARASGHVNTRKAQQDGDLWWRRMRREAKAKGATNDRDVILFAANHIDEPAELEAAGVANGR